MLLIAGLTVSPSTRIEALRHAKETGVISRVVYNSLTPKCTTEELATIQELHVEQAVLLALDQRLITTTGRIEAIKNTEGNGLVDVAQRHGVTKPLVDTCVLDIPSLWLACEAISELKGRYGFVCGCGAHNAVETWRGLTTKFKKGLRETSIASTAVLATAAGADFVLYGPLEHAEAVFPMVTMVNAAQAQVAFEQTGKLSREHPLFKNA